MLFCTDVVHVYLLIYRSTRCSLFGNSSCFFNYVSPFWTCLAAYRCQQSRLTLACTLSQKNSTSPGVFRMKYYEICDLYFKTFVSYIQCESKKIRPLRLSDIFRKHMGIFFNQFLPARRYASAGNSDRNVSVCPSVCPSVRHAPVLCQNEES